MAITVHLTDNTLSTADKTADDLVILLALSCSDAEPPGGGRIKRENLHRTA